MSSGNQTIAAQAQTGGDGFADVQREKVRTPDQMAKGVLKQRAIDAMRSKGIPESLEVTIGGVKYHAKPTVSLKDGGLLFHFGEDVPIPHFPGGRLQVMYSTRKVPCQDWKAVCQKYGAKTGKKASDQDNPTDAQLSQGETTR